MFNHLRFTFILLLFSPITANIIGQENPEPSPKFPIGAFIGDGPNQDVLDMYDSTGFNYVAWKANGGTSSFLSNYKIWATNAGLNTDWVSYYATSYYSKWEAEQNEPYNLPMHVGVKHKYGQQTTWHDTTCWSSLGVTAPACSLMFGPHYRQDQRYKGHYHHPSGDIWHVAYVPRFNLALNNPYSLNSNRNICVLKVVYRFATIYADSVITKDTTFLQDTLKISAFPVNGSFRIFDFEGQTYEYPEYFHSAITGDKMSLDPRFLNYISPNDTILGYAHNADDNGIEFCVDYLGNDSTTLFIDYAEVYDNLGWNFYIDDPEGVADSIRNYIQSFSTWTNINYWFGHDEPYSIDAFTPIHIVDALVDSFSNGRNRVTQYVQPTGMCNGDTFMVDYYKYAKPSKIVIDPYPIGPTYPIRWQDLEWIRDQFQISSSLQPGFWFVGQTFGEKLDSSSNDWYVWRLPEPAELKSTLMLALAHGAKGLFFWLFNSYPEYDPLINANIYTYGMVKEDGTPTELWNLLYDNVIPRLEGRLGDKLLELTYNGNYIQGRYILPSDNANPQTVDYLTLPCVPFSHTANWQAGFFDRNGYSDDKYFFVANLLPNMANSVCIELTRPVSGYTNYRFRNYEGYFDTTFTGSSFSYTLSHSAGEGYLYEIAPVVKYGGKLYASETINNNTLYDDMIIENGVTLTVNAIYDCYANIHIKGNGQLKTVNGGTINFHNGKGIIAEGNPHIYGTSSHKLILDFGSETAGPGIQLLQGAQTTINYCILKNSVNLISSNYSQYQTIINHCDFQNTSSYAISLSGSATKVPSITYCTFTNTDYGIFAAGQSSITISNNTFSNNNLAISLSQIPGAQIIYNYLYSNSGSMPGIFLSSCNGNLRNNSIIGHSIGLSLANSSPLVGANEIYGNLINGIYVGYGSIPDLRASL
ncbi:MAG TPA: right-handed parallel beta-helix repeat-containing protein, partial [Ignavibacteriaceae bacterium]|nr:right-handed parallel beta-helix repeat-containing protein [Ignavibacteriaceae bacterium]